MQDSFISLTSNVISCSKGSWAAGCLCHIQCHGRVSFFGTQFTKIAVPFMD